MWEDISELIMWIILAFVFVIFAVAAMSLDHWKDQRRRRREKDELLDSVLRKRKR